MARPSKCRRICMEPAYDSFSPDGIPSGGEVVLSLDEYEAIRLIDLEKKTHGECAAQMGVARSTVSDIYETAREKIADSIVNGKVLFIAGGNYMLCDGGPAGACGRKCCRVAGAGGAGMQQIRGKADDQMRIAVTYDNGEIFQHFGHTEQFKLYDVEDGKVVDSQVVDTNGQGHGALGGFLAQAGADVLICGGIGGGAQTALREAGIKLYGGASGDADEAVQAYLAGDLNYDPEVRCSHHGHDHGHGDGHGCGHHGGQHENGNGCGHHDGQHHCHEDKHGCSGK